MAKYSVKAYDPDNGTLEVGCGCRGKKNGVIALWRLVAAHDENHDLVKAAKDALPTNPARVAMMRAAAEWAVENGHIPSTPKGW